MKTQGMRWWVVAGLSAAHALMLGLAFPPLGAWPLVFLAPIPLVVVAIHARSPLVLAAWVFLAQLVAWLAIQSWVREVSEAGWPAIAAYLSLWSVFLALCLRLIARANVFRGVPLALVVAVTWVAFDYLRGSIALGGYPWYLLGQPTIGWLPLAQVADLGGQELAGILPAAFAGAIAEFMVAGRLARRGRIVALLATACLCVCVIVYGVVRIRPVGSSEAGPVVLLIQTNIPTSNKIAWSPAAQVRDVDSFARQTMEGLSGLRREGIEPDLAVWPETMLPGPGLEEASVQAYEAGGWFPGSYFRDLVKELRQLAGVPLLLGSGSYQGLVAPENGEFAWDAHFNSVYFIDSEMPDARYDKVHLTPFGERMPLISNSDWLEQKLLDFGATGMFFNLDEAEEIVRFELAYTTPTGESARVVLGTPICFEDTVAGVCREMVWGDEGEKQALLLISLSNDGWFGRSIGGREMHLQASRFRSIENRVPMLRAVNTGISAWIDTSGRMRARLPMGSTGIVVATVGLDRGWTVFGTIGQLPSVMMSIVLLLGIVLSLRCRWQGAQPEVNE
jgi:apolipoprotein N-acyltransferase